MNWDKIYPYLTPVGYPPVPGLTREIGHEISVNYVEDLGNGADVGLVKGITVGGLDTCAPFEKIRETALKNLEDLLVEGGVELTVYDGPEKRPLIISSGYWQSAATLIWPGLFELASENLGTGEILASIPHRDALLIFPLGTAPYRKIMRDFVAEHESDGRKPLTSELFRVSAAGVSPFVESD